MGMEAMMMSRAASDCIARAVASDTPNQSRISGSSAPNMARSRPSMAAMASSSTRGSAGAPPVTEARLRRRRLRSAIAPPPTALAASRFGDARRNDIGELAGGVRSGLDAGSEPGALLDAVDRAQFAEQARHEDAVA